MDIQSLSDGFQSCHTAEELEFYIQKELADIRIHFYGLSKHDLLEQSVEFERLYSTFKSCGGYVTLEQDGNALPESVNALLLFFASIFDRTSANINYNIVQNLPDSSVKFRLKARLLAEKDINDVRSHYTSTFVDLLHYLDQARYDEDNDYTQLIVSFLTRHYFTGRTKLQVRGLTAELSNFQALFTNKELVERFDFLNHPKIIDALQGSIAPDKDLHYEDDAAQLYTASDHAAGIFRSEIVDPVNAHERTFHGLIMGYTNDKIRRDILKYGRADFRNGYDSLSEDEVCLLYCYFNMRKHFFTTYFLYERIYGSLMDIISDTNEIPVFIDLGCGPLTSGLAIADLHLDTTGQPLLIHYIGLDNSPAMLRKAASFWAAGNFAPASKCDLVLSPEDIIDRLEPYRNAHTTLIFNASYLFASDSLEVLDLAKFFSNLRVEFGTNRIYFVFQNPDNPDRNAKFQQFKANIPPYTTHKKGVKKVVYKNNNNPLREATAEDVYFEIFELDMI